MERKLRAMDPSPIINATSAGSAPGPSQGPSPAAASSSFASSAGMLHPALSGLLTATQQAKIYNDSKTAVDLVLLDTPEAVAAAAQGVLQEGPSAARLAELLHNYTTPAGSDVVECPGGPVDWQPEPPGFLSNLLPQANSSNYNSSNAAQLRRFGLQVHGLWKLLCRQVSSNVSAQPERHSLLPLKNQQVVPGDRFRETYYWDSYWVIRGLLVSNMTQSAKALVGNLLQMLEVVGHVPNGARVYYLNRSQPPLLSAMVRDIVEATGDTSLLNSALPLLIREHGYWTSSPHAVQVSGPNGQVYNLSRYFANWTAPRPESYREDAALGSQVAAGGAGDATVRQLFRDLASGAESGWDFSSRWFANGQNLSTVQTTKIIPADLNAWLYQMERNLAWAANRTGDAAVSQKFNEAAAARKEAMMNLLFDSQCGCWRDGILNITGNTTTAGSQRPEQITLNPGTFASNYVPLWAGLVEDDPVLAERVVSSLNDSGLIQSSGIATSLTETGQQWDYPNGWPPLQHMLVEGAARYGGAPGAQLAQKVADTWVRNNKDIFDATGFMHEKYDVTQCGLQGGGGEYVPQVGFGWSNGVVLDFLSRYFSSS